jgi:hypothetical protein
MASVLRRMRKEGLLAGSREPKKRNQVPIAVDAAELLDARR